MLAFLGIPLAIELVKKVLGKRIHLQRGKGQGKGLSASAGRGIHLQRRGSGMRLEPPQPCYGSWNTSSLPCTKRFVDKALRNFDLWEWCGRLKIPLK